MIGLTGLPRTGEYPQAIEFIREQDKTFTYTKEDFEKDTTWEVERAVNKWLTDRYFLFEIDYTDSEDHGSREEVVLLFEKKDGLYREVPDFSKVVAQFYR